ncbi:hypothetical protein D1872_277820 [compost metagenome]
MKCHVTVLRAFKRFNIQFNPVLLIKSLLMRYDKRYRVNRRQKTQVKVPHFVGYYCLLIRTASGTYYTNQSH